MPRIKFNDRSIKALDVPEAGQIEYFDTDRKLPGFGLRISAGGSKSWILLYRFSGRPRRLTLGPLSLLGLADARAKAKEALGAILSGNDPAGTKRLAKRAPTFADLAEEYVDLGATILSSPGPERAQ